MSRLKKLWEQVKQTGFPLEMKVIEILLEKGWEVYSSTSFFDDDEDGKPRELDIKATKIYDIERVLNFERIRYRLETTLIIQCKQSVKRGWIFFPHLTKTGHMRLASTNFLETARKHALFISDPQSNPSHVRFIGLSRELLRERPIVTPQIARKLKWLTEEIPYSISDISTLVDLPISKSGVSLGFSDSKTYSDLFEAAMTSTKAMTHIMELQTVMNHAVLSLLLRKHQFYPTEYDIPLSVNVFIPVIVFNGTLCFWRGQEILPDATNRIGYHFMNRSVNYFGQNLIPVVSSDDFVTFVLDLENDFEKLVEKISRKKEFLDTQLKFLLNENS